MPKFNPISFFPFLPFVLFVLAAVRNVKIKYYIQLLHHRNRSINFSFDINQFLLKYSVYYKELSPDLQLIFVKRVKKFIRSKLFIGQNGIGEISQQMQVLIASKAIQVTFGFPSVYLATFSTIFVFPDAYKSESGLMYKGEVHPKGYIKISWKHLIEGIAIPDDGRNVALHEMAHALHIENHTDNGFYLFIKPKYLVELKQFYIAYKELIITNDTFIRSYAATNFPEFFAVCVELFFEKPKEFFEFDNELFALMSKILNQKVTW